MAQVIDLISAALRAINSLGQGETPNNDEATDVFALLNSMLDNWATRRLLVYALTDSLYNLQAFKQSYQIGTGAADFNVARPVSIQNANVVVTVNGQPIREPLSLISGKRWASITERGVSGQVPKEMYWDRQNPISTLYFWPQPAAAIQAELFTWQAISQFVTLQDNVIVPPGFDLALRYNLAKHIADEFGMPLGPNIAELAQTSLVQVAQFNANQLADMFDQSETGDVPTVGIPPGATPAQVIDAVPTASAPQQ